MAPSVFSQKWLTCRVSFYWVSLNIFFFQIHRKKWLPNYSFLSPLRGIRKWMAELGSRPPSPAWAQTGHTHTLESRHYGLNCVRSKFPCWKPNQQDPRMWLYLDTGPLKWWVNENEAFGGGLIWCGWCPSKMRSGNTKRHQGPMCTEGQPGEEARDQPHCKRKREVSEETNPASWLILILDFQLLEPQGEKTKSV